MTSFRTVSQSFSDGFGKDMEREPLISDSN